MAFLWTEHRLDRGGGAVVGADVGAAADAESGGQGDAPVGHRIRGRRCALVRPPDGGLSAGAARHRARQNWKPRPHDGKSLSRFFLGASANVNFLALAYCDDVTGRNGF